MQNHRERLGDDLKKETWLSNLDSDAGERRNLAERSDTPKVDMLKSLEKWRKSL